jgi:hypothetical protein
MYLDKNTKEGLTLRVGLPVWWDGGVGVEEKKNPWGGWPSADGGKMPRRPLRMETLENENLPRRPRSSVVEPELRNRNRRNRNFFSV